MRRFLTLFLLLTLLSLAGCGGGSETPAPAPTPAPTAAPTPEPTAVPEEPGSGYVTVHMMPVEGRAADCSVSAMVPVVSITGREAAATAVNEDLKTLQMPPERVSDELADAAEMRRSCTVMRSDSSVLSLVFRNTDGSRVFNDGISYSTRSGERITFSMLAEDEAALAAVCREYYPGADPADGRWYFTDTGLGIGGSGSADGVVPYAAILHLLKEEYMPPEREPVSGILQAAYTTAADMDALTLLDEVSVAGGMESVVLWAEGRVRDVFIASVGFREDSGFTVENALWNGSMLQDGEAVRINVMVPEGIPNLMIAWNTDEGSRTAYLSRDGETGQVYLANSAGDAIDGEGPYSHITVNALLGHWANGKTGAEEQAVSFAGANVCYLWHKGLGYDGDGFLWTLRHRDDSELPPQIQIMTPRGQLIYEISDLAEGILYTDAGEFTRAEAVG